MRHVTGANARIAAAVMIVATLGIGAVAPVGADQSSKTPVRVSDDFSSGSIRFVVEGIPAVFDPATYKVVFTNDSIGPHVLVVYKIPDGTSAEQLRTLLNSDDPPPEGAFFVNDVFAKPGQTHQGKYDVTVPGTYGYFCPIPTPAGVPHFNLGFVDVFEVT
jgi:plastocyanin